MCRTYNPIMSIDAYEAFNPHSIRVYIVTSQDNIGHGFDLTLEQVLELRRLMDERIMVWQEESEGSK